jgi:hypothetical protein
MKYVKTFENFDSNTTTKDELKKIIEMSVEDSDFSIHDLYIYEPSYYGDSDVERLEYEKNKKFKVTIEEIFDNNSKISDLYKAFKADIALLPDGNRGSNNFIYKIKSQEQTEDGKYAIDPDMLEKNSQNLINLISEVEAINKKLFDLMAKKYDFTYGGISVKNSLQGASNENPIVKVNITDIKFKAS